MGKKALITGITGQDGSYLAELLVDKGYEVHGLQRRTSTITTQRIAWLHDTHKVETHYADLADANSIIRLLMKIQPDEIYNLGSMSHVRVSFDIPEYTAQVTGITPLRILEALRTLGMMQTKFYQASSSEMFGLSPAPQNETTPMLPVSPYGCAKLFGYHITRLYRFGYKMFACNGILFNHESERRGETFVTKKIVRAAVRIKLGIQETVTLGNLDARRDWGFAGDYMKAVWMIMQHSQPDDFVVATGENYSVKEFMIKVFERLGLDYERCLVFSPEYYRPNEVPELRGDPTKIREILGWKPEVTFDQLIDRMIEHDMNEESRNV